jgi:S1-C subfamily serine protease
VTVPAGAAVAAARPLALVLLAAVLMGSAGAAPRDVGPGRGLAATWPAEVRRAEPALVGLAVRAAPDGASSAGLGVRRFASGVIVDPRGYAVTVSSVLLDAVEIEARLRDGRRVPARLSALDLDSGLGLVKLPGDGPWPTVALGASHDLAAGTATTTVGVGEDDQLVWARSAVAGVRRFSASWEYMLERGLLVGPSPAAWSGSAVLDSGGALVAVAALRLGAAPHLNMAIPVERLTAVQDELIAAGRVVSRPPRPWLGLYTAAGPAGVVVEAFAAQGPARAAGFRTGDRIVGVNGVRVGSQEEFYAELWRGQAGDVVRLMVERDGRGRVIRVRSSDRYGLYPPLRR